MRNTDTVMKESKVNVCRSFTGGGVKKGQGMKPATHLQLMLWLRMCGAIPLFTPYAFRGVQREKFTSNLPNNIKLTFSLPQSISGPFPLCFSVTSDR